MSNFELKPKQIPVCVGWRVVLFNDGAYKNHPRKFQSKTAYEEFMNMMKKTGEYERVELREILKVDGL